MLCTCNQYRFWHQIFEWTMDCTVYVCLYVCELCDQVGIFDICIIFFRLKPNNIYLLCIHMFNIFTITLCEWSHFFCSHMITMINLPCHHAFGLTSFNFEIGIHCRCINLFNLLYIHSLIQLKCFSFWTFSIAFRIPHWSEQKMWFSFFAWNLQSVQLLRWKHGFSCISLKYLIRFMINISLPKHRKQLRLHSNMERLIELLAHR